MIPGYFDRYTLGATALMMVAVGSAVEPAMPEGSTVVTRKQGWEDSTKNPDWTDIETMMRAMGALHSADVVLMLSPLGIGAGGGLFTAAICTFVALPGSSLPAAVSSGGEWPCKEHATLTAHVFSLLYDLDFEISKVYKQEGLWK